MAGALAPRPRPNAALGGDGSDEGRGEASWDAGGGAGGAEPRELGDADGNIMARRQTALSHLVLQKHHHGCMGANCGATSPTEQHKTKFKGLGRAWLQLGTKQR